MSQMAIDGLSYNEVCCLQTIMNSSSVCVYCYDRKVLKCAQMHELQRYRKYGIFCTDAMHSASKESTFGRYDVWSISRSHLKIDLWH